MTTTNPLCHARHNIISPFFSLIATWYDACMPQLTVALNLRVPSALERALAQSAEDAGTSKTAVAVRILSEALNVGVYDPDLPASSYVD